MTEPIWGRAMGIGGALVAGAAVAAGVVAYHTDDSGSLWSRIFGGESGREICLISDIKFVEGAPKSCYAPSQIADLKSHVVLDNKGAGVALQLHHPSDDERAPETVRTCAAYDEKTKEGWYALSTADMRRELYFTRACGALDALSGAGRALMSHFDEGRCARSDIRSLADGPPFRIEAESEDMQSSKVEVSEGPPWRLSYGDQTAYVQEIAHADFNGDGRGDILVYIQVTIDDGAAATGMIGILDKPAPEGPVRFRRPSA